MSHAKGYLALGLHDQAAEELAALPPEQARTREALWLRASVLQGQEQWTLLESLAEGLVREEPEEAGGWIIWAYASRRANSLEAAEAILRDAETRHPNEPTIQFNLGCYACQQGNLSEAKRRIEKAIHLHAAFRESALTDPDLAPLREAGFKP